MTSEPSLFAQAYALANVILAENIVAIDVSGTQFIVGFNDSYSRDGRSEIFDAQNVIISIMNLNNSPTALDALAAWNDRTGHQSITVDIRNEIDGVISYAGTDIAPLVSINVADVLKYEYMGPNDEWFSFTIQGIFDHEVLHLLTGFNDGPRHNDIVNNVYAETEAGPPRQSYDAVRRKDEYQDPNWRLRMDEGGERPKGLGDGSTLGEDDPLQKAEKQISPLVLDLDGDGLSFTGLDGSTVYFDLDADGFAERTGWVEAEDGILARDLNGNGRIDDIGEVFGNATTDGFTELAALDANGDGVIDAQDPGFAELTLWIDADRDGWTDTGELHALADFDITAIDLNAALAGHTVNGNTVSHTSTFTRGDGSTGEIVDVWFDNSQIDTLYDGPAPDAWFYVGHGNLRGYGTAPDLVIAMSQDAVLAGLVLDLTYAPVEELYLARQRAEDIVLCWTGADTADPAGRGAYVDGRHLAALETFAGRQLAEKAQHLARRKRRPTTTRPAPSTP